MEDKKLKKNLRLLSKKKGSSLRPDKPHKKGKDNSKTHEKIASESKDTHKKDVSPKEAFEKLQAKKEKQAKHSISERAHKKEESSKKHHSKKDSSHKGHSQKAFAHGGPSQRSNATHVVIGILIASLLVLLALLWPYLPFNKGKVAESGKPQEVVGTTLEEIMFGDEDGVADDNVAVDENGFVIIDENNNVVTLDGEESGDLIVLEPTEGVTVPTVISTPAETVETAPVVVVNEEPTVVVTPRKTVGEWGLLYMNTEKFDIDDEDDDVTELYLKDVCKSIFKQNSNVVNYCRESSKLKSSTAKNLGKDKCDGGGSCVVGKTCLVWNSKEEDDGDLKSYTAMYRCE